MRRRPTLALLALGACTTLPYQPARELLPAELPEDAFARVCGTVRFEFPRIIEADAEQFVIRTDWSPSVDRDVAAQRRLTLWREGVELCAVVEARFLTSAPFSLPRWSSIRAHPEWERDTLARALAALTDG